MKNRVLLILFVITVPFFIQPFFHSPGLAQNLPDTVRVECLKYVPAEATVTAEVTIWNDEAVYGFQIPLTFYNPFNTDIICDSVVWSSTFLNSDPLLFGDTINGEAMVLWAAYGYENWPIGDNLLATLYFTTGPTWNPSIAMIVDSTQWYLVGVIELADSSGFATPHEFVAGCQEQPVTVPSHLPLGLIAVALVEAGLFGYIILRRRRAIINTG